MEPSVGFLYESYIAVLAQGRGYKVKSTGPGHDSGGDLLLFNPTWPWAIPCLVVQCKWDMTGNVGVRAVQEAYTAKDFYDADTACVVSNREFTAEAHRVAAKVGVELYTVKPKQWMHGGWLDLASAKPLEIKSAYDAAELACQAIRDHHVKKGVGPGDQWECTANTTRIEPITASWGTDAASYVVEGMLEHRWRGMALRQYQVWTWSCRVWPYTGRIIDFSPLTPVEMSWLERVGLLKVTMERSTVL